MAHNPSRLLVTDLDGTFIGDQAAMLELWADLDATGITVVFATGRHLESIHSFYAAAATRRRAAGCIAMVGTEIWLLQADQYLLDTTWREHISAGWDRPAVTRMVAEFPRTTPQPDEWQSLLKCSYFLDAATQQDIDALRGRLAAAGLRCKVVYSAGRFLDILPAASGKGHAVAHLAARLGIDIADIITAGDTGNDIDMMRPELGFRSIAVGNAAPELAVYRPDNVYHAAASFAAGIREGLAHYGWLG